MATGAKLTELLQLLDLEQIEENIFRAQHPADRQGRLYGGQIMAQALMAGGLRFPVICACIRCMVTFYARRPQVPAVIRVERARDSRSLTRRIWSPSVGKQYSIWTRLFRWWNRD